jgi:Flavin containing amine oxidoreductase
MATTPRHEGSRLNSCGTNIAGGSTGGARLRHQHQDERAVHLAFLTAYARQYLRLLESVWPGATKQWNGQASISTPWSDPNLLGSYACWKVGQYTGFSGHEGVRQRNIHFAGEHCSINFQGFMEGGAEEGVRAANEILTDSRIPL